MKPVAALAATVLLGVVATREAYAQWRPPPPPPPPVMKDGQWRGLIGASLAMTGGNSETTAALLNADLSRQTAHTKIAVQGFVNYGTSKVDGSSQTTAQKWGLSNQYDSDFSLRWFRFGKIGFDGDRLIDLSLRSTVSAGVGYHVVDTNPQSFNVFGGLSYTDRRYRTEQVINERSGRHFSSVGGLLGEESTYQINDQLALKQRLELYPEFSQDRAHMARFNGSFNVSMSNTLSLSVGLLSTYNHRVPPGIKKTDTSLFTGVNVKLGY